MRMQGQRGRLPASSVLHLDQQGRGSNGSKGQECQDQRQDHALEDRVPIVEMDASCRTRTDVSCHSWMEKIRAHPRWLRFDAPSPVPSLICLMFSLSDADPSHCNSARIEFYKNRFGGALSRVPVNRKRKYFVNTAGIHPFTSKFCPQYRVYRKKASPDRSL